jgi:hypothetical protein
MAADNSIWPPIITGLFAFGGVLAGLGWNALQAPRAEKRLRDDKRRVLRTSLWAELTSLAELMNDEIEYIASNNFTWVPLVDSFRIYLANIENLGLLTPTEAQKITVAYYQYQESAGYIAQIAKNQPDKPAIGRHIEFDFEKTPEKKQDVINTLSDIASTAADAAKALQFELSATTDWLESKRRASDWLKFKPSAPD